MKGTYLFVFVAVLLLFNACKRRDQVIKPPNDYSAALSFQLAYHVDQATLLEDTLLYTNAAGYKYSVTRLQYFLSRISLIKPDSSRLLIYDYQYADAFEAATSSFISNKAPAGDYIGVWFYIGVDSAHNIPYGLPSNTNNNNMEWPVAMGGGYHLMKLEGRFSDSVSTPGYAMHVGTNGMQIPVAIYAPIHIKGELVPFKLSMNINEWFRNPNTYNFSKDGNYTMGIMPAMKKLSENGKDVFTH